ncbi:MAG TPA: class I SAM-dependent methyltransferase [Verrucomicrobiales bacterium]|nr:class I SAM-dependent methyltransferase [Verrucomicrobiales bacterium]
MADRESPAELAAQYARRFTPLQQYRQRIWGVLTSAFFQRYFSPGDAVLDLGCGWGEFINQIKAGKKFGMDLNPDSARHLSPEVQFLEHDCSVAWPVAPGSLDAVFTSNFFEHLPDKTALKATLAHAFAALKPGGRLICLGPNIKCVPGAYWDFFDHHVILTDLSLREILELTGFAVDECRERFLPYTAVGKREAPLWMIRLYLKIPLLWRFYGGQFLVVARKP